MTTRAGRENLSKTFISFSGIDGAGKSTQIQALCAKVNEGGLRLKVIRFWDDVAQLTGLRESTGHKVFKGDKGVGTPSAPINRRDKNVQSWSMTCVRLCVYLVDAVSVRRMMTKALHADADVIIFDRFIYDELANLSLRNPLMRAYVRLIMTFVPKPHISYLLDADPAQARARKPEYPLAFLYTNRQSYLTLSSLIGGITVIPPMQIEAAEREILKHAMKQLPVGINWSGDGLLSPGSEGKEVKVGSSFTRPTAS